MNDAKPDPTEPKPPTGPPKPAADSQPAGTPKPASAGPPKPAAGPAQPAKDAKPAETAKPAAKAPASAAPPVATPQAPAAGVEAPGQPKPAAADVKQPAAAKVPVAAGVNAPGTVAPGATPTGAAPLPAGPPGGPPVGPYGSPPFGRPGGPSVGAHAGVPTYRPSETPDIFPPFSLWPARVWPVTREAMAPGAVIVAALIAGLVGAVALRVTVVGIGFALTAIAVLVPALVIGRRPSVVQVVAVVCTCALLGVGAVRGAGWIFVLCVATAWVLGALALVGGRTWTGLLVGAFAPWFAPVRTAGWSVRGLSSVGARRNVSAPRIAAVAVVTIGLLVVFGTLFASADKAFADLLGNLLPEFAVAPLVGRVLIFGVVTVAALAAAYLANQPPKFDELAPSAGRPVQRWEWVVPVAVLDLLFLSFVIVQLTVLFGGDSHVLSAGGPDYADYARQGFWQLLMVSALTLLVIAVAVWKAGRAEPIDRLLVRLLLGVLSALALVIVASALRRMWLYEEVYGVTRLRILVHAVELWLGVVFVLVLAAGVALRAKWLPRAVIGTGVLTLLALAALNPDAYLAERNIDRFERTQRIDVQYLSGLSVDAVPALDQLPEPRRSCALVRISEGLDQDEPWYQYNAARERARTILAERPVIPSLVC